MRLRVTSLEDAAKDLARGDRVARVGDAFRLPELGERAVQSGRHPFVLGDAAETVDRRRRGLIEAVPLGDVTGQLAGVPHALVQRPRDLFRRRDPAVAIAEQADEERPALLDLIQTDRERAARSGFLFRDAPAQIETDEVGAPLQASAPELWKHDPAQVVAFRVHVAERGGDEDADGGSGRHGFDSYALCRRAGHYCKRRRSSCSARSQSWSADPPCRFLFSQYEYARRATRRRASNERSSSSTNWKT